MFSWLFRLIKGMIIGTGFIIPGVSGGVFAAIFGIYEPMIRFFGNIKKDFWKNIKFFLPIGIGGIISVILTSRILGDFFKTAQVPLVWFFIGCVLGTLPMLYKKAGEEGRKNHHFLILIISCVMMFIFLLFIQDFLQNIKIPTEKIWVWLLAGILMAMGAIIPGLSPSNFLLYMGIYGEMMERMGSMDLSVLLPVFAGAAGLLILLSKVFDKLFERAHAGMYHFIIGIIIASTIMIIPWNGKWLENGIILLYDTTLVITCLLTCMVGVLLASAMDLLERIAELMQNRTI